MADSNPFAVPSDLPFAFPPFDAIRHEHYRPAFDPAVAEQRAEVEAIATDPEPPTFSNTVEALERSGRTYSRVLRVFGNLAASMATPEMQALEAELAPLIAEHTDSIRLDPRLFARLDAVHAARLDAGLTPEQVRVVERYHRDFVRAGAALPAADRDTLRSLNVQLTSLTTEFGTRVLAESNDLAVHVADRAGLDGLSANAVEAAASAAESAGLDGFLLTLSLPTIQPAISSLTDRHVRRRLHEAATSRGTRGGAHDIRDLVTRISRLRAERAALLGFTDHAGDIADDQTAGSTKAVLDMLGEMVGPAMANLGDRARPHRGLAAADGVEGPVQPWDWAYYAEQDKAATYDVDANAVKPYFEASTGSSPTASSSPPRSSTASPSSQRTDLPVYADGRPRLRGARRRRQHARPVRLRLVRPAHQAGRRLDGRVRRAVPPARHPPGGRGLPQRAPAARGAAGADDHRRGAHRLPRVRARPARPVLRRGLPAPAGHGGAPRLRGVPLPGQRDVGVAVRGPRATTPCTTRRGSGSPRTSSTG